MARERFYITTALYYANDVAHLGHVFEVIGADVLARYMRLSGRDVFFLSGTDEHGEKMEKEALKRGVKPEELVEEVSGKWLDLWKELSISHDDFIRTTEPRHHRAATKFFEAVRDNGDIHKGAYKGWYCVPCESFLTESQLEEGNCPECGREATWNEEESYFFKLSNYQKKLEEHIEQHPNFIKPAIRKNEMINSFLKPGLHDISISRTSIKWGIPLPGDPAHVVYVWFDALINYLTGIGYPDDMDKFNHYWPADVHVVGKDILKFHTMLWPAMLMAAGIEPPKQIFGHGFITLSDEKMSKSKGNIINPRELISKFGSEALRYYLMREVPYGGDGAFSSETFIQRFNSDLANDLGNLLSRSLSMIGKYRDGSVRKVTDFGEAENKIVAEIGEVFESMERRLPKFEFNNALAEIWGVINSLNKYIQDKQPWALAKDEANKDELDIVLYTIAEGLRCVGTMIYPFIPLTAKKVFERLGIAEDHLDIDWQTHTQFGFLPDGAKVTKGEPMFPRIE